MSHRNKISLKGDNLRLNLARGYSNNPLSHGWQPHHEHSKGRHIWCLVLITNVACVPVT